MANKNIEESQQSSQGITLGTSGNQGGAMPEGAKGSHHKKAAKDDISIPHQEKSSKTNSIIRGDEENK
jgi:hypothetical protein